MAKHNDLGKAGENAAAAYLEKEDYLTGTGVKDISNWTL